MHRALIFLSRFILGVWVVIAIGFLSLLLLNAPNVPINTPFASASINAGDSSAIYLPNRIFTCSETAQQFQCQTELQSQTLGLVFEKRGDDPYNLGSCRAQYDGRSVGCQKIGQTYAPVLSNQYEVTNLELSSQELQAIQHRYQGINTLMKLGEVRLFRISAGLSLAAGISAFFFTWLQPSVFSKAFVSIASGFGSYHLVWQLLGSVSFDVVTPYGLTPDTWGWVVDGGAIAAGVGTAIATAVLLWQNLNGVTKVLISLISSVGILCLFLLSFYIIFGFGLGSITTFLSQYIGTSGWLFITLGISIILAGAAAIWLWSHTSQSIKRFLSLGNGFGASAITMYFFVYLLLGLGYAD